jgi:hypothetical protein
MMDNVGICAHQIATFESWSQVPALLCQNLGEKNHNKLSSDFLQLYWEKKNSNLTLGICQMGSPA